jgi:hypothetical protein
MCWSAQVSLSSYVFAMFGFVFALAHNFNWRILLYGLVFSQMQLVEYFLWKNLNNKSQNLFWSNMGRYVVWGEMFAAANVITNPFYRNIFFGLSALQLLVVETTSTKKLTELTTIGPNGHLQHNWYSDSFFRYLIPLPLLLIVPFYIQKEYFWGGFVTLTAAISALMYWQSAEFSSMWCYLSLFFWVIVIFQSIGLDKKCMSLF